MATEAPAAEHDLPLPPPGGDASTEERVFLGLDGIAWPVVGVVATVTYAAPGELDTRGLVEWLKHANPTREAHAAWGDFVVKRSLKPEIDYKEFRELWATVTPKSHDRRAPQAFAPQWYDRLRDALLQSSHERPGVVSLTWSDGGLGSMPTYTRGRFLLEHLALLPREGAGRYVVAADGRVLDRWRGVWVGAAFLMVGGAEAVTRRLNRSNRLRWASQGLELPDAVGGAPG